MNRREQRSCRKQFGPDSQCTQNCCRRNRDIYRHCVGCRRRCSELSIWVWTSGNYVEIFNGWNKFVALFYLNKTLFVIVFLYSFNKKNNRHCLLNSAGKISVIEALDFGADIALYKFSFTVNDGKASAPKATLSIIVQSRNEPPEFAHQVYHVSRDEAKVSYERTVFDQFTDPSKESFKAFTVISI